MSEVSTTLGALTATASADGVEVTVTVEGRLVALTIEPNVLSAGPRAVAALIFRLTQEAAETALHRGVEALTPFVADELADELRALVLPTPAVPGKATGGPGDPAGDGGGDGGDGGGDDEFPEVRSWALPH